MENNKEKTRVVVAMSGGVDSSVAAALLVEEGYEVIGMMLRLWSEPGMETFNRCCTPESMSLARRVAAHLEIPFYAVDIRNTFKERIVDFFIDSYASGVTPNPCMQCNRYIRFGELLAKALGLGASHLATGHYARVRKDTDGHFQLLRGVDTQKDQSYVLSVLKQNQLSRAMFPVGAYTKPEIRDLARKFNLPVADRSDSQDLCFLAGDDYRNFIQRNAPEILTPGAIVNTSGDTLGEHGGLPLYTIGQRKGLGVPSSVPLYVLEKDVGQNAVIVGTLDELGRTALLANQVNWIGGSSPETAIEAKVKIRYKANEAAGIVYPERGDRVRVEFEQPLRDITPGQAAVFYEDETCLGGGIITKAI